MIAAGPAPALVSIHSFTPVMRGAARPWQVAVLWDADARLAAPLMDGLRAHGISVGDNEPYDGALVGDTLYEHGTRRGLPHVLIEARQDLVADEAGAQAWADVLAHALKPVLAREEAHAIAYQGTRTVPALR